MLTGTFTGNTFRLIDFKPQQGGINAEYYIDEILKTVQQDMKDHLSNAKDQGVRMVIDNAPAHNANLTKEFLRDSIFQRIDHPPYSPDLTPSDFWLFGEMKGRMRGQIFQIQQHLADFCTEFAEKQSEDKLKSVFDEWQSIFLKFIDNSTKYLF
ncbi:MAG: hypothetical protein EZS28_040858 [Streblomastix strix]|uniref:Tc1-like transposase DDE domain-containing protein n=1 Tax=Streblomastix strix TaxID=222440 RepID=A0A5J4U1V3_9EUKA|nr:MAG: hypothetical protein EZS28_040858 [Streblomastix strix]